MTPAPANPAQVNNGEAPLEPGIRKSQAKAQAMRFPGPPTFTDKHEERAFQKGRLALAFRLFAKYGYDEGVAGHITLRDRRYFFR
jgi:hypothetical protein